MTPSCGLVAVIAIACLVQHVSSKYIAPYYAAGSDARRAGTGKYIVVLKKDDYTAMNARAFVTREFRSRGRRVRSSSSYQIEHLYDHAISGFSATLTDDLREQMRSLPEVKYIEEVVQGFIQFKTPPPPPPPPPPRRQRRRQRRQPPPPPKWGLDRIDQRNLPLDDEQLSYQESGGAGVHIYIVDTGVRRTHNEFKERFSNDGFDAFGDNIGIDCNGHGTHVAGTAAGATYGVASQATIHSVRVLDCDGTGGSDGVLRGMEWIAKNAVFPAVTSMSIGLPVVSATINDAVENLFQKGIVVSVAAGNDNTDACDKSPSSAPNAITVGATDKDDKRAIFRYGKASNFGPCLDIFAPGKEITSAWIGSDDATAIKSGTSMACPHVSGVAAILLGRDPTLTPADITAKLIALSSANKVSDAKSGSPNRLLYIGCDSGKFQCRSGSCIPTLWLCDGYNDCGDSSDETHSSCSQACDSSKFQCRSGSCIPTFWLCDGYNDCGDSSDETHSSCSPGCDSGKFQCRSGSCIYSRWLCDGDNDCGDNSDETHSSCSPGCDSGKFQCRSGSCIYSSWLCDGDNDCGDNSDETHSSCSPDFSSWSSL